MSERSYAVKVFSDPNGRSFYVRDYGDFDFAKGGRAPIKKFSSYNAAHAHCIKEAPYSTDIVDYDEAANLDFLEDHLSHV